MIQAVVLLNCRLGKGIILYNTLLYTTGAVATLFQNLITLRFWLSSGQLVRIRHVHCRAIFQNRKSLLSRVDHGELGHLFVMRARGTLMLLLYCSCWKSSSGQKILQKTTIIFFRKYKNIFLQKRKKIYSDERIKSFVLSKNCHMKCTLQ